MRSFEFPVDRSHAHSVNETFADVRRLRAASIVTAVSTAAPLSVASSDSSTTSLPCVTWTSGHVAGPQRTASRARAPTS